MFQPTQLGDRIFWTYQQISTVDSISQIHDSTISHQHALWIQHKNSAPVSRDVTSYAAWFEEQRVEQTSKKVELKNFGHRGPHPFLVMSTSAEIWDFDSGSSSRPLPRRLGKWRWSLGWWKTASLAHPEIYPLYLVVYAMGNLHNFWEKMEV